MISLKQAFSALALTLAFAVCQAQQSDQPTVLDRFNTPTESLVTGGQPSPSDLDQLKQAGVTKIVNLRGPGEGLPFDEKAKAKELGLDYVSIPVSGAADVTSKNARQLHEILQGSEKVFVHCASGNRVGALLAIRAHEIEGRPVNEALQLGRAAGLTSLEGKVKSVLSEGEPHD